MNFVVGVPDLTVTSAHTGSFTQGGTGSYTLTVTNAGTASTSGTVTLTDTVPAGLTPGSASGTGWSCSIAGQAATCTRTDALAAGASYPAVTLSVSVAADAPSSVTNVAKAAGGGEKNVANSVAYDTTLITGSEDERPKEEENTPDLTILSNHVGDFQKGWSGTYTITVMNQGGGSTSGPVTVTDIIPKGLIPASAAGDGWACTVALQVVTCTRSDALPTGTSYPDIRLTVAVAGNTPATVTNLVRVSGGGEAETTNSEAVDVTNTTKTAGATLPPYLAISAERLKTRPVALAAEASSIWDGAPVHGWQ